MQIYKIIILFSMLLLLITVNNSISQNSPATDSLKMLLEKSSGIEKANLLKEIGDNYQQAEYHQKAITYYQKSLEIYNEYKDTLLIALVSREIGVAYYYLYDFDKAINYFLKALKRYEQNNNSQGILSTLNRIANTYSRCFNKEKALEYYLKSYEISKKYGNNEGIKKVLHNIGMVYLIDKDYKKALEYLNKSLLLAEKSNDSIDMSTIFQNIALVYLEMEKYDIAFKYFFIALELAEKYNHKLVIASICCNIANIYIKTNNIESAKEYLDRSLIISKNIGSKGTQTTIYKLYTLYYAIKGDLKKMWEYANLGEVTNDSVTNERSERLIAEMQTKYETEKKEQQIKMLNIKNKLKEAKLQARTYWLLIFIIAFALVLIYIILKRNLLFANKTIVQKNLEIVASENKLNNTNAKLNSIDNEGEKTLNQNFTIKYAGSILTDRHKIEIKNSIINYMNNNKNYLNIDYTLNTFANDLDIKRKYISQVINESFKQNFSNFLNEYRIKEARKIMSSSPNFKYTIESVAEMVGYKSKTTFNNAFKKNVGVTPSFYLKYIKNEVSSSTVPK